MIVPYPPRSNRVPKSGHLSWVHPRGSLCFPPADLLRRSKYGERRKHLTLPLPDYQRLQHTGYQRQHFLGGYYIYGASFIVRQ